MKVLEVIHGFFLPAFEVTTFDEIQQLLPELNLKDKEQVMNKLTLMMADPKKHKVKHSEYLQKAWNELIKEDKIKE